MKTSDKEIYVYVKERNDKGWRGMIQCYLLESNIVSIESDYGTKHLINKDDIFEYETTKPIKVYMDQNNINNIITKF